MRRSLTCVAVVALGVSALSACGGDSTARGPARSTDSTADTAADDDADGGGSGSGTDGGSPAASGNTTTRSAAPTTTTPPYSFDGSVPPPDLLNTGTDYAAIFESLDNYRKWLTGHHPDVQLLENAYAPGSAVYARLHGDLELLQRDNTRLVDTEHRMKATVVSIVDDLVNLVVEEHVAAVQLIAADGVVLDEQVLTEPIRYTGYLVTDPAGHWRVGALERLTSESTVQL